MIRRKQDVARTHRSPCTFPEAWKRTHARKEGAFTLLEVIFATVFAALMGVTVIESLVVNQRFAARTRLYTNARAIVQRNLDAASGVSFTGTASTPSILAVTSASGVICDDDLGTGAPVENIQVLRSGTNITVSGTLTRIVTNEPVVVSGTGSNAAVIVRRITFKVDYDYLARHYTYSETTLRSMDTQ